ncbi:MAG: right-handed parallel beta-helix repeat-containing protein [Deltaproteobacteria bacterium]|nr:right-handed parallel beta-helix repeat-containing protein [Deltaproteobacteria bacterium]
MSRNSWCAVLGAVVLVALLLGAGAKTARAAGFVVNSDRDDIESSDANLLDGICLDGLGDCTLRAAIEQANANGQADTITFSIAMNIYVSGTMGAFPPITDSVIVNASSVWDSVNNRPGVMLNGGGGNFNGLQIDGQWCEVYGLHITNFGSSAIYIHSANNTIGGNLLGRRNVLSGNGVYGVIIASSTAANNLVQANFIGIDPTGSAKQPNSQGGVYIGAGAEVNTIGGGALGTSNYISGNGGYGIFVVDSTTLGNKIGGNFIGIPATGSLEVGNSSHGIYIWGAGQTEIGGGALSGNLIARNGGNGVFISAGWQSTVQNNYLLLNGANGVRISDGPDNSILLNLIAQNVENGVLVSGPTALRNEISSNSILKNGQKGVELQSGGNTELAAPAITAACATQVSGTATGGARVVQVYSDSQEEGETYHGMCIVSLPSGAWTYTGAITGPNVTALSLDVDGNTSEFSAPFCIDCDLLMLLPTILQAAKSKKRAN